MQNKVAESSATLPVAFIIMTLLWWWPSHDDLFLHLFGWLTSVATTYFIIETNAKYAFLRIRSQMMAALFLLVMAACAFLHPFSPSSLCQLCLTISLYALLHTYHDVHAAAHTFYAAVALSIATVLWAPLVWFMPVLLWCLGVYLRNLDLRNLGAALCGFLLPYIAWSSALAIQMYYDLFTTSVIDQLPATDYFRPLLIHGQQCIAPFHTPDIHLFQTLPDLLLRHPAESAAHITVGLIGLTGFIHYMRKSYDDKIQVRMYHYSYMTFQAVMALWMLLQPSCFRQLFPLFIIVTVPSAAHFIAFTRTWFTNFWCLLLTLSLLLTTLLNISPLKLLNP